MTFEFNPALWIYCFAELLAMIAHDPLALCAAGLAIIAAVLCLFSRAIYN